MRVIGLLVAGVALLLSLSGASVAHESPSQVVVALGDSITEGDRTNWPDYVATTNLVVNFGIAGNGLVYGPDPMVERIHRQALFSADVHTVVLLGGINDIQMDTKAGALIAGLQMIRSYTRDAGVRLLVGTVTPWRGWHTYTEEREQQRRLFNAFIRSSGEYIDFDVLLQDPADPLRLRPEFDSGDHLHPNDAAFRTMARAVVV